MKYHYLMRAAAFAATWAAGCALAQTPAPVLSDVTPPPAEDRSSTGAIVLEHSLVRAQRENAFDRAASRTGVASIGRGVLRATMKAQAQAELAQAREEQARDLYRRGAASQTPAD